MLGYRTLSPFTGFQVARGGTVRSRHSICRRKARDWAAMYRVSNTVRSTHNQDGAIVLDLRQGQMFNLNFVGSRILELLKSGSTESAIVDGISREFGVRRELAENDVREFLQNLRKCQLVEELEDGAAV
jgi:Coenzyme PQQ synthesis protein D (PqqD)